MNKAWQQFLIDSGADRLPGFAQSGLNTAIGETDTILAELGHLGLLRVSGDEAADFLQNLLSNDLTAVTESRSQLSSFCTAKGRMLAIFRLYQQSDGYVLRMPLEILDAFARRLQMYVLRSNVTIETVSDYAGIGIAGPQAVELSGGILQLEQMEADAVQHRENCTILRVPGINRFEMYGPVTAMQTLWSQLSTRLIPLSGLGWRLLDIENGIPTVFASTSEHFVPQMTNLQLVGGVSFKKGCYPGQEVVARMQYLGKLKRRMYRVRFQTQETPAPGTAIVAWDGERTHEAGEIVDACRNSEQTEALAVLPIADADKVLHIHDEHGPRLELLDLPYPFPEA